jgi:hypothetical protein
MVLSVLPLVVVCLTLSAVLWAAAATLAHERAPATATAQATVSKADVGSEGLEFDWADQAGAAHHGRLVFPDVGRVPERTRFTVHYVPSDPGRYFAVNDAGGLRLRYLVSGLQFALLVLVVGVLTTGFRLWRRVRAERRPARTFPVRWAQYRRGLIRRSWLVVEDAKREWWVPVYWEPELATLLVGTPCRVHGNPALDRLLVIDVHGTPVWPAGRRRPAKPRRKGEWVEGGVRWTKTAEKQRERERDSEPEPEQVPLARHLAGDVALVLPAPVLGLVWAYLDGSGLAGFAIGTALVASVLFWLPGVFGSDPT